MFLIIGSNLQFGWLTSTEKKIASSIVVNIICLNFLRNNLIFLREFERLENDG